MNERSGMRATPAGKLMNVRTTGQQAPDEDRDPAPADVKKWSASSISCGRISR